MTKNECCEKLKGSLPRFCPVCGRENDLYPKYAEEQERQREEDSFTTFILPRLKWYASHRLDLLEKYGVYITKVPDERSKKEDLTEENFMPRVAGSTTSFRCECGCNVFSKIVGRDDIYVCNGCRTRYVGVK